MEIAISGNMEIAISDHSEKEKVNSSGHVKD